MAQCSEAAHVSSALNGEQKRERKVAVITGITGQDGSYLAEFLLSKGYEVHGILRRSSSFNTGRIEHLYQNPQTHTEGNMKLHYGDLTDSTCLVKIINQVKPTEIYNLGAQSHVKVGTFARQRTPNADRAWLTSQNRTMSARLTEGPSNHPPRHTHHISTQTGVHKRLAFKPSGLRPCLT